MTRSHDILLAMAEGFFSPIFGRILLKALSGGAVVSGLLLAISLNVPSRSSPMVVLLIGDSIVGGRGDDSLKGGMLGRLGASFSSDMRVEAVSIPGATSGGLLEFLKHQLSPQYDSAVKQHLREAQIVILSGGLNDFWAEASPRRTASNLRAMAKFVACAGQTLRGQRPHVTIATLLPTTLTAQQMWSNTVNSLLIGSPQSVIGAGPHFHDMDRSFLGADGLHPSPWGYDWLTERASQIIHDLAASDPPMALSCAVSAPASEGEASDSLPRRRHKRRRPVLEEPRADGVVDQKFRSGGEQ
jgi:lysophospholipase L1-like esterase